MFNPYKIRGPYWVGTNMHWQTAFFTTMGFDTDRKNNEGKLYGGVKIPRENFCKMRSLGHRNIEQGIHFLWLFTNALHTWELIELGEQKRPIWDVSFLHVRKFKEITGKTWDVMDTEISRILKEVAYSVEGHREPRIHNVEDPYPSNSYQGDIISPTSRGKKKRRKGRKRKKRK